MADRMQGRFFIEDRRVGAGLPGRVNRQVDNVALAARSPGGQALSFPLLRKLASWNPAGCSLCSRQSRPPQTTGLSVEGIWLRQGKVYAAS